MIQIYDSYCNPIDGNVPDADKHDSLPYGLYYYVRGKMGMMPNGHFTLTKRCWKTFTNYDAELGRPTQSILNGRYIPAVF